MRATAENEAAELRANAKRETEEFERQFWGGAELSQLYQQASNPRRKSGAQEQLKQLLADPALAPHLKPFALEGPTLQLDPAQAEAVVSRLQEKGVQVEEVPPRA